MDASAVGTIGEKRCSKCKVDKARTEFTKNRSKRDGLQDTCRPCQTAAKRAWRKNNRATSRARDRAWRRKNPGAVKAKLAAYRQTYPGACRHRYHGLKCRCTGRVSGKGARSNHIYVGLPYCTWEEFWAWAQLPEVKAEWDAIMAKWQTTRAHRDRPSIDRLSAHRDVGYVPGNMRWCTSGDNSTKAAIQRHHGRSAVSSYYISEENQNLCV